MSDKEKIIDTIIYEMVGTTYRHGGELVKIISDKSGVNYDTCYEILEDIVKDTNIKYAEELIEHPLINEGNGFMFSLNFPACEIMVEKIKNSSAKSKNTYSMKNNGTAYMIFVLGYDLLQKELTSYDDCPCDLAYEICCDIYNEFLESEEAEQDKSEYECLQDWIENHQGTIDRLIETNFRLVED